MDNWLRRLQKIFASVARRLVHDRCWGEAAALSFTTLIALVPMVTVVFSMLSLFPVFETWARALEDFVYSNMLPAASDTVHEYLNLFVSQAGGLTAIGLIMLFLSALFLFATIENAFNEIWRIKSGRRFFQRLIVYWTVITLGPLLIVASLSVSSYILSLPFLTKLGDGGTPFGLINLLPILFELAAFVLFYTAIPNCEVRFKCALIGGIVATILFEIAKRGFVFFVLNFGTYQVIYGALAAIPIFLVWVYLSWLVVLIGAHVAAACQQTEEGDVA